MQLEDIYHKIENIERKVDAKSIEQRYLTKTQAMAYIGYDTLKSINKFLSDNKISVVKNRIDKNKIDNVLSGKR